jgi:hypothetical protein
MGRPAPHPGAAVGGNGQFLKRDDQTLRGLNNWYRAWANARDLPHLILTETKGTSILGMIVQPGSADPGLANVQTVPINTDHTGICKPANPTTDIYVLVRDFVTRPVQRWKPDRALLEEIAAKVGALETKRAAEAGIEKETILALAQRLKPDEVIDFDQAVKELTRAVETAIAVSQQGAHGSNLGDLVDTVLARIADNTRAGDFDGAAREPIEASPNGSAQRTSAALPPSAAASLFWKRDWNRTSCAAMRRPPRGGWRGWWRWNIPTTPPPVSRPWTRGGTHSTSAGATRESTSIS